MAKARVLVLRAPGTNCDQETVEAWRRAGALVETLHINRLLETPGRLREYQILTLPGGFSYGDDLGAGRVFAARLTLGLGEELGGFHQRGGLILGICNGFQVLVRAGLLPGPQISAQATLAHNESGRFEARWVVLQPTPGSTPFVSFTEPIELPVAHGEGRFLMSDPAAVDELKAAGRIALAYADRTGQVTESYPANPNGSWRGAAGLCDATGRIFGLMPHPERFIEPWHHPRYTRLENAPAEGAGMLIFRGAVDYFA